jgi:hypothetical protein
MLRYMEANLPLEQASVLHRGSLRKRLYAMSEGLLGELATIIRQAGVKAVEEGWEVVDDRTLDALNWIIPSKRRSNAEDLLNKGRKPRPSGGDEASPPGSS